MVGLKKDFYGKGPTKAKTFIHDEYVFVVMEGGLTRNDSGMRARSAHRCARQHNADGMATSDHRPTRKRSQRTRRFRPIWLGAHPTLNRHHVGGHRADVQPRCIITAGVAPAVRLREGEVTTVQTRGLRPLLLKRQSGCLGRSGLQVLEVLRAVLCRLQVISRTRLLFLADLGCLRLRGSGGVLRRLLGIDLALVFHRVNATGFYDCSSPDTLGVASPA